MSMLSQKSDDWRHIAVKTQCNNTPNGSPQYTRVPGIPFLAGVVTFIVSTAPKHWDSSNIHQFMTPRCYTSIPSYVPEYEV